MWLSASAAPPASPPPLAVIGALAALTFALLALGCWVVFRARSLRRPFWIDVDEYGLRWNRPGDSPARQQLHWGDVRSFFMASFGSGCVTPRYALVLDGGGAALAIDVRPRGGERERQAAQALARLTFARTRLSLRDVTPTLGKLGPAPWRTGYKAVYGIFTSTAAGRAPLWPDMPRPMSFRRALRPLFVALLLSALVFPVARGIGWIAQRSQAQQYDDLLRRIHMHKPLYRDSLAAPDGDWSAHASSRDDPRSFGFANGAYEITANSADGNVSSVRVLAPGIYGNAAVEVTVRTNRGSGYGAVGLVLHDAATESNRPNDVTFYIFNIGPDPNWAILRHNPAIDDGSDRVDDPTGKMGYFSSQGGQSIRTGAGEANRMLVVMRGGEYVCYINDSFMGSYQDPAPTAGRVGIEVLDSIETGAFTDFAVYPI